MASILFAEWRNLALLTGQDFAVLPTSYTQFLLPYDEAITKKLRTSMKLKKKTFWKAVLLPRG